MNIYTQLHRTYRYACLKRTKPILKERNLLNYSEMFIIVSTFQQICPIELISLLGLKDKKVMLNESNNYHVLCWGTD